jgi:hypothetical protein
MKFSEMKRQKDFTINPPWVVLKCTLLYNTVNV